jgi:hypothetical protein
MFRGLTNFVHIIFRLAKLKNINIKKKKEKRKKNPKRVLAPKKVHTRSHPDPEPTLVVDNPEQFLKQKTLAPGSVSRIPLHKSPSFSGKPVISQNPDLDTFP